MRGKTANFKWIGVVIVQVARADVWSGVWGVSRWPRFVRTRLNLLITFWCDHWCQFILYSLNSHTFCRLQPSRSRDWSCHICFQRISLWINFCFWRIKLPNFWTWNLGCLSSFNYGVSSSLGSWGRSGWSWRPLWKSGNCVNCHVLADIFIDVVLVSKLVAIEHWLSVLDLDIASLLNFLFRKDMIILNECWRFYLLFVFSRLV